MTPRIHRMNNIVTTRERQRERERMSYRRRCGSLISLPNARINSPFVLVLRSCDIRNAYPISKTSLRFVSSLMSCECSRDCDTNPPAKEPIRKISNPRIVAVA